MADPYASGVLDQQVHKRLVDELAHIARDANIQPAWVWTPLGQTCGPEEVEWVKRFRFHASEAQAGLCLVGAKPLDPIEDRMAAIAGALTRNFIRARVVPVNQVVDWANSGGTLDVTCALVPNFFLSQTDSGQMAGWRQSLLYEALLERYTAGLQTVLYVSSLDHMTAGYGLAMRRMIDAHYQFVKVG